MVIAEGLNAPNDTKLPLMARWECSLSGTKRTYKNLAHTSGLRGSRMHGPGLILVEYYLTLVVGFFLSYYIRLPLVVSWELPD